MSDARYLPDNDVSDLVWPEGRFSVTDSKIALGPGEARDFTVRVPVASGNIDALIADATRARVERIAY